MTSSPRGPMQLSYIQNFDKEDSTPTNPTEYRSMLGMVQQPIGWVASVAARASLNPAFTSNMSGVVSWVWLLSKWMISLMPSVRA